MSNNISYDDKQFAAAINKILITKAPNDLKLSLIIDIIKHTSASVIIKNYQSIIDIPNSINIDIVEYMPNKDIVEYICKNKCNSNYYNHYFTHYFLAWSDNLTYLKSLTNKKDQFYILSKIDFRYFNDIVNSKEFLPIILNYYKNINKHTKSGTIKTTYINKKIIEFMNQNMSKSELEEFINTLEKPSKLIIAFYQYGIKLNIDPNIILNYVTQSNILFEFSLNNISISLLLSQLINYPNLNKSLFMQMLFKLNYLTVLDDLPDFSHLFDEYDNMALLEYVKKDCYCRNMMIDYLNFDKITDMHKELIFQIVQIMPRSIERFKNLPMFSELAYRLLSVDIKNLEYLFTKDDIINNPNIRDQYSLYAIQYIEQNDIYTNI